MITRLPRKNIFFFLLSIVTITITQSSVCSEKKEEAEIECMPVQEVSENHAAIRSVVGSHTIWTQPAIVQTICAYYDGPPKLYKIHKILYFQSIFGVPLPQYFYVAVNKEDLQRLLATHTFVIPKPIVDENFKWKNFLHEVEGEEKDDGDFHGDSLGSFTKQYAYFTEPGPTLCKLLTTKTPEEEDNNAGDNKKSWCAWLCSCFCKKKNKEKTA